MEPSSVLDLARRRFRIIAFDRLRREDLGDGLAGTLRARSEPCELGEADAFLSHSAHLYFSRF